MLIQFSVENFRSFKEPAILSMEASRDTEHSDNTIDVNGKTRLLRSVSIFGPNAAGKSNIFKAFTAAILAIRQSNMRALDTPMPYIVPFNFSAKTIKQPSAFEFIFIAESVKYVYGFATTNKKIITEYLYKYKTARRTTIFERDINKESEYHFTSSAIRKELQPISERNSPNKLFLTTAAAWNSKELSIPYRWFQKIDTYDSTQYNDFMLRYENSLSDKSDNDLRLFIKNLLHEADINIQDYKFSSENMKLPQLIIPGNWEADSPPPYIETKRFNISMIHSIKNKDGVLHEYSLNMNDESKGTSILFLLGPLLMDTFNTGKILCIDEFDSSLHPLLILYLVKLFNDPKINKNNAQLIISTHTTELLSLRNQRRDQIYFVEKNNETGESELYSLDEFSPRTNSDIRKSYIMGRYGAVPNIDYEDFPL